MRKRIKSWTLSKGQETGHQNRRLAEWDFLLSNHDGIDPPREVFLFSPIHIIIKVQQINPTVLWYLQHRIHVTSKCRRRLFEARKSGSLPRKTKNRGGREREREHPHKKREPILLAQNTDSMHGNGMMVMVTVMETMMMMMPPLYFLWECESFLLCSWVSCLAICKKKKKEEKNSLSKVFSLAHTDLDLHTHQLHLHHSLQSLQKQHCLCIPLPIA